MFLKGHGSKNVYMIDYGTSRILNSGASLPRIMQRIIKDFLIYTQYKVDRSESSSGFFDYCENSLSEQIDKKTYLG